jgi:competence protein ComEA
MRSRKAGNEQVAQVARRRLELLAAELAAVQPSGSAGAGALDDGRGADTRSDPGAGADTAAEADLRTAAATDNPPPYDPPAPAPDVPPGRHARRSVGARGLVLGWLQDRVPATLQGRVQLGSSHLAVVALLVAGALAVTAWWVVRAGGAGTVVPARAPVEVGTSNRPSAASSVRPSAAALVTASPEAEPSVRASPTATVVVDVAGKVRHPGIATLPAGSRVVDALEAAGGPRRGVDTVGLNLARVLVDGEQIVVGRPAPGGVAAPAASAPGSGTGTAPGAAGATTPMVNINTASLTQLEELPGVGPVTAQAIAQWRTEHGAFSSVDELLEVSGIGEATLSEMAPFVTL